jgi:asparagine synthase (glutamine-hydrolysing)
MKAAAQNKLRVILDGQGSDECLAGYPIALQRLMAGHLRRLRLGKALKVFEDFRKGHFMGKRAAEFLLKSLLSTLFGEHALWLGLYRSYRPLALAEKKVPFSLEQIPGSRLDQYLYHLLFSTFLPTLLHSVDRISMAFSVECRVPFLDHRLVEFIFSLGDEDKISHGETKYILRRSLEKILPEAILARRDKQQFLGGEMAQWLRGPLKHLLELPVTFDGLGVIDERKARRVLRQFGEGDEKKVWLAWRLALLSYWASHQ